MKTPTKAATQGMLAELRSITGKRPLTYGQSLYFARVQASHFREWAQAQEADVNLAWLIHQKAVPVHFVPSFRIGEHSGLTTDQVSGKLEVFINESEPRVRQRFSLLHEWKHVLDFPNREALYSKLGSGNDQLKARLIELLANEFAAYVLMPTGLVKRVWFQTQNLSLTASFFNVSLEAMTTRLEKLGIVRKTKEIPRAYFRAVGSFASDDYAPALAGIEY